MITQLAIVGLAIAVILVGEACRRLARRVEALERARGWQP